MNYKVKIASNVSLEVTPWKIFNVFYNNEENQNYKPSSHMNSFSE